ncbi:MAG: GNAT family N-acetyltransferase [Xanthomonadaceae bacterium]|nr:GNAT family N-acetyltransferase [Xanthomonadaceae bacterium]
MEVLPFEMGRDLRLYIEGSTEAFLNSYPGVSVSSDIARDIEAGVRALASSSESVAFTLCDDRPIGFVVVSMRWFYVIRQGYVDSIFVCPEKRGIGASRYLLRAAELWSFRNGARTIALDVSLSNHHAIQAYRSAGYSEMRVQMEKSIN